jgi:anti-anti-sigma factor
MIRGSPVELLKTEFVQGDPPVLQVDGEIDISTADQLRVALENALSADPNVIIDMGGVTFFDAAGLRVVLQAAASHDGAVPVTLINAARVAYLLDLVGLGELSSIVIRDAGDVGSRRR